MESKPILRGERPTTNRRSHTQCHSSSSDFLRDEEEESEQQESGERNFYIAGEGGGDLEN